MHRPSTAGVSRATTKAHQSPMVFLVKLLASNRHLLEVQNCLLKFLSPTTRCITAVLCLQSVFMKITFALTDIFVTSCY